MTEMKNKKILKKDSKQKIKKRKNLHLEVLVVKKLNIIKILSKIQYYMFKNINY